ncbi:hypothetical protein SJAG_05352 [Schizosaccharomyces japonicus yFS275]|uniref:Retrotransposon gag domain-containing protein n=1 Tax=Schizosaccharomyces japonicus (strain yFS275 / FY16936) TaxID=402676 RepID=B6K8F6_SCHJY|nr:hypothetical protein SJAG_05352 [Schizosaccharomyces japonicus yFS275]EEB04996.2 hypothetical protein SJAG_05352 [Schizosaccharomyces japonicus yFS275]
MSEPMAQDTNNEQQPISAASTRPTRVFGVPSAASIPVAPAPAPVQYVSAPREDWTWAPKPFLYDGTPDLLVLQNWIRAVERFLRTRDIATKKQAWTAYNFLTGAALDRCDVDPRLHPGLEEGSLSWLELKTYLKRSFTPGDALKRYRLQFYECRQKGSALDFITELDRFRTVLKLDEWLVLDQLERGAKPNVARELRMRRPANLDEAIHVALSVQEDVQTRCEDGGPFRRACKIGYLSRSDSFDRILVMSVPEPGEKAQIGDLDDTEVGNRTEELNEENIQDALDIPLPVVCRQLTVVPWRSLKCLPELSWTMP